MRRQRVMERQFKSELSPKLIETTIPAEVTTFVWNSKEGRKLLLYTQKEGRRGAKWRLFIKVGTPGMKIASFKNKLAASEFMVRSKFQDTKNLEMITLDSDLKIIDIWKRGSVQHG